jgi:GNAT superfamily N-acetyltransferase
MYEWLFAPPGGPPPRWDPGLAAQALRRAVAADGAVVLVAILPDEFVGFCTAYEDMESVRYGRRVWVEDLAVDPAQRSAGIGKRLLDEAKQWARARGATHLKLDSAETRTASTSASDRAGGRSASGGSLTTAERRSRRTTGEWCVAL